MPTIEEIRALARSRLRGVCRVCAVCDGARCAGEVPGIGGIGTGSGFVNNFSAFRRRRLNLRALHPVSDPDLRLRVFGLDLDFPILAAPVGGAALNFGGCIQERELAAAMVVGARSAGSLGMSGDGPDPEVFESGLAAVRGAGGAGVPVAKPRGLGALVERAARARDAGAVAFGVDVDAAGLVNMTRAGQAVGPVTPGDLARLVEAAGLPVVVKGVMTPDEAVAAAEAGAAAIVVSNHGGRSLDDTPGTLDVLPAVAGAVGGRVAVLVDGGVRTGADVLKCLALGADAVMVGRPLAVAAVGGGAGGVEAVLRAMADELRAAMILTGSPSVGRVDASRVLAPRV